MPASTTITPAPLTIQARWWLLLIVVVALAARLYGVSFGLPALYDPDEPVFVMKGLELLRNHTLDPGWFGHPGTTTIYALALIDIIVYAVGHLLGHFANPDAFSAAIYRDPGIVFLPGRLFIVACGVACVPITFLIGRRVFDTTTGLVAAALLALNPLHVEYSQLVRTDVHSTVFMLLCVLASIAIARRGALADYIWAGICVGLACATKWPAASIIICPFGASLLRVYEHPEEARTQLQRIVLTGLVSVLTLIAASPFLVLDFHTVLIDLHGEERPQHLGATGGSFLYDLGWYLGHPILGSAGIAGAIAAVAGLVIAVRRSRIVTAVLLPPPAIFLVIVCTQALIWERWVVPLLPFLSLLTAVGIVSLAPWVQRRTGRRIPALVPLMVAVTAVQMLFVMHSDAQERLHDTRADASQWVRAHIPPGSSIVVEHAAFDLLGGNWRFLFPIGHLGCVDVRDALGGHIRYTQVEAGRDHAPVLDLGTVAPTTLDTCRADYALLSHYDRYHDEAARWPHELRNYADLMQGGVVLATFRPEPGVRGGPVVRIVRLRR